MIRAFWKGDPGDTTKHLGEWKPTRDLLQAHPIGVSDAARQRGAETTDAVQGVLSDLRSRVGDMRASKHYTGDGLVITALKQVEQAERMIAATLKGQRSKASTRASEIGKDLFSPVRRHSFTPPNPNGTDAYPYGHFPSEEDRRALRAEVWRRWEKITDAMERENFYREALEAGDGIVIGAIEQLSAALGGLSDEMREAGRLHFSATWHPEKHAEWTDEMRVIAHLDALESSSRAALVGVVKEALPSDLHRRVDEAVAIANAAEAGAAGD